MKKALLVLTGMLVAMHVSVGVPRCASWEDEKKTWEDQANLREKDPGYAAKLSLNFIPVDNGHFYVGEVARGVWFSVGQTVSVVAAAVPILNSQSRSKQNRQPVWTDGMVITSALGGVGYLALKVWAAFDAAEGARRYNRALAEKQQQKQGFHWELSPDGVRVTHRWG